MVEELVVEKTSEIEFIFKEHISIIYEEDTEMFYAVNKEKDETRYIIDGEGVDHFVDPTFDLWGFPLTEKTYNKLKQVVNN